MKRLLYCSLLKVETEANCKISDSLWQSKCYCMYAHVPTWCRLLFSLQHLQKSNLHQVRKSQCENNTKKKFSTDLQYNVYRGQRRIWNLIRSQKNILDLRRIIMSTREVSQECKSSFTIPIYKKGQKACSAMKLLTKIITQHLSSTVSISGEE